MLKRTVLFLKELFNLFNNSAKYLIEAHPDNSRCAFILPAKLTGCEGWIIRLASAFSAAMGMLAILILPMRMACALASFQISLTIYRIMLTNITYKTLDNYFKTSKNSLYEYSEPDTYSVRIFRNNVGSKWVYDLCVSYKSHTVWTCGGYATTTALVYDLLNKANKCFEVRHIK